MRKADYMKPRWEPSSPGLTQAGKPLRIRLIKCAIDHKAPLAKPTPPVFNKQHKA